MSAIHATSSPAEQAANIISKCAADYTPFSNTDSAAYESSNLSSFYSTNFAPKQSANICSKYAAYRKAICGTNSSTY